MSLRSCFTHLPPIVILSLVTFAVKGTAQSKTPQVPDDQIQADVQRSLAGVPELVAQHINASISSGVVTLSGSVQDDTLRRRADEIASTTRGVRRVVDELTVGGGQLQDSKQADGRGVLLSDGSYAPSQDANATSQMGETQMHQQGTGLGQSEPAVDVPPANGPNTDPYGRPLNISQGGNQPYPESQLSSQRYPPPQPNANGGDPGPNGRSKYGPPVRPTYDEASGQASRMEFGQVGGKAVTVPPGTVLRVRVNQHLSSRDVNVGTPFDAMVINDVVADGQVAIPRGAFVQGIVVDAASSGHLKGRGELGLQLTEVTLGGRTYAIQSDVFSAHGGDKTLQTVNSTLGLGALGAIFGAVAGGGAGAAIGAGVGGAAGLGVSAASGRGDVFIPSEAALSFRLTQPANVTTVSQTEMQRLAYGVPTGESRGPFVRRPLYPYPYVGPVYYPYPRYRYYRPYGYYSY